MGCDFSSQTVRPDTCGGTSSLLGVTLDHDSRRENGLACGVSNLLNRPDKMNATEVHEGHLTTNQSIQSDSTCCVDKLICDVARITYPQNVIAAIKRGDTEVVKTLCRATAGHTASGINSLGTWNSSALMIATQHARIEIAHFLLSEIGIEIDRVNDKGVTTLFVACAGGHYDIVSRLLGMGANMHPKVVSSYLHLKSVHSIQDPRDLYTYLTLGHPNTGKVINATPLSVAVMNGQYKCVDALIRYGVEVNTRFNFPLYNGSKIASTLMTPIMLAGMYGHDQIVQLLLIHNADCMLTDSSDSNVLHYALSEGPNAVAVFTILHTLLEETDLRKLVLIADKRGYTPLHNACISNHVDVIPVLVSLGCNVDARTRPPKIRENILERTVRKMDIVDTEFNTTTFCDSIKLIDETHDDEEEPLKGIEPSTGNSNITESSIEMTCDVSMLSTADVSNSCHLPLTERHPSIQSIISNQFEVVKMVGDDEGAHQHQSDDTDHVTKGRKSSDSLVWGITPLHIAVKRRSIAAVTSLIAENADPRVKDDSGVSPLDMAYKLCADSPILFMLNKAAADKEMLQLLKNNLPLIISNGQKSV